MGEAILAAILEICGYLFYGICVVFNWVFKRKKPPLKIEFESKNRVLRDLIIALLLFGLFVAVIYSLS